jgi:hypothetical protein
LLANAVKVISEIFKHIRVRAQLIPVDGRVASYAPWPFVVVNDHELAWDIKKSVKATHNDNVHVQEQSGTAQSVKILREGGEFGPTTLRNARGQIKGRNG